MEIPEPVVEQDEDGIWCARVVLRPGVTAFGDGATREEALEDLYEGLELLLGGPESTLRDEF